MGREFGLKSRVESPLAAHMYTQQGILPYSLITPNNLGGFIKNKEIS